MMEQIEMKLCKFASFHPWICMEQDSQYKKKKSEEYFVNITMHECSEDLQGI